MRPRVVKNTIAMQERSRLLRALQSETPWVVERLRDHVLPPAARLPASIWADDDMFRAFASTPYPERCAKWSQPDAILVETAPSWRAAVEALDSWFGTFPMLETSWLRQHVLVVLNTWTADQTRIAPPLWEGWPADDHHLAPPPQSRAPRLGRSSWLQEAVSSQAMLGEHGSACSYRWAALYIAGANDDGSFGWSCRRISAEDPHTTSLTGVRTAVRRILTRCGLKTSRS